MSDDTPRWALGSPDAAEAGAPPPETPRDELSVMPSEPARPEGSMLMDDFVPDWVPERWRTGLAGHLCASFFFSVACGFLGGSIWFVLLMVVYWLVLAVLQIEWWRKGYDRYWRPAYSWVMTAAGAGVVGIPGVVAVSLLGPGPGVFQNALYAAAWIVSAALPLSIPRFRRWLFQMLRPYDTRPTSPAEVPIEATYNTGHDTTRKSAGRIV